MGALRSFLYMAKRGEKKIPGRDWFDGKDEDKIIAKCAEHWAIGGNDAEASTYANVSASSLCRYLQAHPDIAEYRDRLQQNPFIKARKTIHKSLDNPQFAFEYMKRKKKDEFSERNELTGKDGLAIKISDDELKQNIADKLAGILK